jgi:D-arabinose 1-dehydrogenase-like Zn-dependent alcohol dehydrogenase
MEVHGSIYPLTVSADKVPIKLHDAVSKGVRVQRSSTAARRSLRSLFAFVAEHNIQPYITDVPHVYRRH